MNSKTQSKTWTAPTPEACAFCDVPIQTEFIDGRTIHGPWAIMCPTCHLAFGTGLGLGHGQMYLNQGGTFVKG